MLQVLLPLCAILAAVSTPAHALESVRIPVLVPLTGFLSLEGTSQRNGAVLAFKEAPASRGVTFDVSDTATSPESAVNAFERAYSEMLSADGKEPIAAMVAPMLGTQMLALLPLAAEYEIPLVTVSGTASITERDNPYIFRFFPGDAVVKTAHARYAVEELGAKRPAILFQTTAYGQSGREHLIRVLTNLGAPPVLNEGLDVSVKDMLPVLSKVRAAGADMLLLHLHAGSTALVIRQAASMGLGLPIVAGSAMHQPATAALLDPAELNGVCAESGSSPISAGSAAMADWVRRYRSAFDSEPDAFALAQYDAVNMVLAALAVGARDTESVRSYLSSADHTGLAMNYRSDGKGNMAHDAVIICYDGVSRLPQIAKRYKNLTGGH